MGDLHKNKCSDLREQLHQHVQGNDEFIQNLINALDAFEREPVLVEKMEQLTQESMRLKQEIVRLRDIIYSKDEGNMSSKLRDALRE